MRRLDGKTRMNMRLGSERGSEYMNEMERMLGA